MIVTGWTISSLLIVLLCFSFYISGFAHWDRDFEIEVMETGYRFFWEDHERPDYYKYHPEKRKN